MGWTPDQLPDLHGKTFVITGGNSGLGLEAAKILAGKSGRVVITARDQGKADQALAAIREAAPNADIAAVLMDLADLDSVERGAADLRAACPRIDAIVNNAGVMQTPPLKTKQGFELQFGTNHLGHFRLVSRLIDVVEASAGRIVPVASMAHETGRIDLADPNFERRSYVATVAYCQSKLANVMFGFELERRLRARGGKAVAIPCHPGYAATNLQTSGPGMEGGNPLWRLVYGVTNRVFAQTPTQGAYGLVMAAAAPEAQGGHYYGPTGIGRARGPVGDCWVAPQARDEAVARGLWELSERLVGPFFATAPAAGSGA